MKGLTVASPTQVLVGLALVLVLAGSFIALRDDHAPTRNSGETNVLTLTAHDIRFDPADLTLTAGVPVRLEFVNAGLVEHDVSIAGVSATVVMTEPHDTGAQEATDGHRMDGHAGDDATVSTIHLSAHPGERVSVEFTPKAGSFELLCTVPGHREAGMVGRVVVGQDAGTQ